MTTIIELQAVTRMYGDVIGVNDLTLNLESKAYGLIGPNGSGKTTLINLLIGQLRPTLGDVRVFGATPSRDRSVLRRIGLCPGIGCVVSKCHRIRVRKVPGSIAWH